MIEINKCIETNAIVQCSLCEKYNYKIFELKRNDKILCMCQECLNDLSNYIVKLYKDKEELKKRLKGACIKGIIIEEFNNDI